MIYKSNILQSVTHWPAATDGVTVEAAYVSVPCAAIVNV